MKPWYQIENIDEIDSPALVIYEDRVRQNIDLLLKMIGDPQRLRPHVKTHKTKEGVLMMMEAGIRKFKCATIAEAEMLGSSMAPDVLLAYQPVGPKADRFISLIKKYPTTSFSCLIDNMDSAKELSKKAVSGKITMRVYLDINVGMNRTGIKPGSAAFEIYKRSSQLPSLQLIGLHVYDGHIHDTDLKTREENCNAVFAPVEELRNSLIAEGFQPSVVAGGSPGFPVYAKKKDIECSPGTFIFWDAGYREGLPEQAFLPAAVLISRIISIPDENIICTDLGHKSVAAENVLSRRVVFMNAPELEMASQSEEHLVAGTTIGHDYKVGDVLYGLPFHICPTCALYERALVVKNGKVVGEWKIIGRDRKITT